MSGVRAAGADSGIAKDLRFTITALMKYLSTEPMFFSMYSGRIATRPLSTAKTDAAPLGKHRFILGALGMCQKCGLDREGHRLKFTG